MLFKVIALLTSAFQANCLNIDPRPITTSETDNITSITTLVRDVLIYGGGASGSHAASRLRDMGKSVVVIEQEDRLGGAAHAYHDSVNNRSANYGVQLMQNTSTVRDLYARYDVPLVTENITAATQIPTRFADFQTGQAIQLPAYSLNETQSAFETLFGLYGNYSYLNDTYDLPREVLGDLLITVDAFIAKYQLQSLSQLFNQYLQSWPEFSVLPTLYLPKFMIGSAGVNLLGSETWVRNANDDNGAIFRSIQAELGEDALLASTIIKTQRPTTSASTNDTSTVWVQTPTGVVKVLAKRILVTVPPVPENMQPFDLSASEASLFKSFKPQNVWTGLLRNSGIPSGTGVNNVGSNTTYHEIKLPGSQGFVPTADPLLHSWVYSSYKRTSENQTKALVLAELTRLTASGVVPVSNATSTPEFVAIKQHHNYAMTVSKDVIASGFYRKLYALQGFRGTVYTGGAFTTQGTANVLEYNEKHVLPLLV